MKKVLCEKNHYYDADRYDACPHCARARAFLEKTAQQPQGGALPPEADTEAERCPQNRSRRLCTRMCRLSGQTRPRRRTTAARMCSTPTC